MTAARALGCGTGLATGNFVWALVVSQEYLVALDRSFFQAVALISFVLTVRRIDRSTR